MHGGVVRDPVYWKYDADSSAVENAPKSIAAVVVRVPGSAIFSMLATEDVRTEVVLPSSVSWNGMAKTRMEPSRRCIG